MTTALNTVIFLFLAVRTVGGLWMVWRNVRQAFRELPYQPCPPWLELLYQSLRLLVWASISIGVVVDFAQRREFAMLFLIGVIWLSLLLGFLQKPAETREKAMPVR